MLQLQHLCDISRNTTLGTNGRKQLALLYSGVACLAIPMNSATAVTNGFDLGRAVDFYFDVEQDIRTGDVLTFSLNTYVVKTVQKYQVPVAGHTHVMAQQEVS